MSSQPPTSRSHGRSTGAAAAHGQEAAAIVAIPRDFSCPRAVPALQRNPETCRFHTEPERIPLVLQQRVGVDVIVQTVLRINGMLEEADRVGWDSLTHGLLDALICFGAMEWISGGSRYRKVC